MKEVQYSVTVIAASSFAALMFVGLMMWRQNKKQKRPCQPIEEIEIPKKWKKVGEIKELMMYPLKGAKRKCLTEAEFTKLGLREVESTKLLLQDRVFVLYNAKYEFVTSKKNTKVLLLNVDAVDETSVKFSFPGADDIIVNIKDCSSDLSKVEFYFGEMVSTMDCGDDAAKWFSERLCGQPSGMRLGCFVQSLVPTRNIDKVKGFQDMAQVFTKINNQYLGAYGDIASYMLMTSESVEDLNTRLEQPVSEHNFRPNILVSGTPAYSEDSWDWVRVGDSVILRSFMPCTRCMVTTLNPETAEKHPRFEPLQTLKKYRQVKEAKQKKLCGESPVMGLYLGCHRTGVVRVGDPVYINEK